MPPLSVLPDLLLPARPQVGAGGAGGAGVAGVAGAAPGNAPLAPGTEATDLAVLDDPVELRRFTRYRVDAGGHAEADSGLRISGMHCAACAGLIEQAVGRVPGVLEATVSAAGERARVRWDPQQARMAQIVTAIRRAGYDASPDIALADREARQREHRAALWRLFVAAFCAMQVMMLATPSYVAGPGELAPDLRQLLNWGSWLMSLPVMVFSVGPFLQGAWRSLQARRIGMDVPVALGILVTFVASTGATFAPDSIFGTEVYFDSLTMFVSFLLAGRWLETRARHQVAQVLEDALGGLPETALRLDAQGQAQHVSVLRLAPGDRVRVPVGQAFPADGAVTEGDTRADESLLTGERVAVAKPCGAAVVAGSINLGAPVLIRVDRVGDDTRLQAIVALMRDAMSQRPALARAADRWAAPFLWAVLLLAAGAAAVWSVIDPARAVWVAVAVLIVTCPCALSLAAPAALLAAASALARRGVLLQRLDALEAFTQVQRIYLDKTGTVTDEHLRLCAVHPAAGAEVAGAELAGAELTGAGEAHWLALAASLAGWSVHPLSKALVAASARPAAAGPAPAPTASATSTPAAGWQALQELAGHGLQAMDAQGRCWRLGRQAFAAALSAQAGAGDAALPLADGLASTWLGCDGRLLARFDFDEALRPDALSAVAALRRQGLQVLLLSGDRPERAARLGAQLAVDGVIGGATPERKLAEVVAAQAGGQRVAMVGDGINDAPVLAQADVSFAMGQGALVARAQADAVVASNRLGDLALTHRLARQTMRVVRQNLLWAAVYNSACIPLALLGWLPPWAAGLGMALSSLLVIANSLRLSRPLAGSALR